jgi:carboxylesterase type B
MTSDETRLSKTMINFWSNFVKTGNPNTPVTPQVLWPRYYNSTDLNINFETPNSYAFSHLNAYYCDFWDSLGYNFKLVPGLQRLMKKLKNLQ